VRGTSSRSDFPRSCRAFTSPDEVGRARAERWARLREMAEVEPRRGALDGRRRLATVRCTEFTYAARRISHLADPPKRGVRPGGASGTVLEIVR